MILPLAAEVGLIHALGASCVLFVLGVLVTLVRREAVVSWMGILLVLQAAALALAAFARQGGSAGAEGEGRAFALLVLCAGGIQATVALAILWRLRQVLGSTDLDRARRLGDDS